MDLTLRSSHICSTLLLCWLCPGPEGSRPGHNSSSETQNATPAILCLSGRSAPGFPLSCAAGYGARPAREDYEPSGRIFVPGHDQAALHQRVAKIGSIADFLQWFDNTTNAEANFDEHGPTVLRGDGRMDLTVYPDGRINLKFDPKKPDQQQ